MYANALFLDRKTDRLYYVDRGEETVLEWDAEQPVLDGGEGGGEGYYLPYEWLSKLYQLPQPTLFAYCQIKADDYEDLTLTLYGDGVQIHTQTVLSATEFVLPEETGMYSTFQFKLSGTSRVRGIAFAEDIDELMQL